MLFFLSGINFRLFIMIHLILNINEISKLKLNNFEEFHFRKSFVTLFKLMADHITERNALLFTY